VLSIVRGGPSELFRGFLASSLRDAPYAGLFLVFYEATKHEAASVLPPSSPLVNAALHSGSAATAGTFATLATHPFDVIKVPPSPWFCLKDNAHLYRSVDKDASSP
jgi:solute carrier family 25 protein 38